GQRGLWGFVRGGMGAISTALARSAEARGARIRTSAEVRQVLVKDGKACGVALVGGEEIRARIIISNADPKRTFLGLIERGYLDEEFRHQIESFRVEGSSLKINLALDGLPNFKAYPGTSLGPPHKTTMHVCPSMDYIDRAWETAQQGRPSE